jgi:hypothetical protein
VNRRIVVKNQKLGWNSLLKRRLTNFTQVNYANKIGFRTRKGKVQRLSNGTIRKRFLFCSKQGFRLKKQADKITKYKRKETRTGCNAMIQFSVENGKWVVSQFSQEHNHHLEDRRHITRS